VATKKAGHGVSGLRIFARMNLVPGRKGDAGPHLADSLIDQRQPALAMAALVGFRSRKLRARILQQPERRIHVRLGAERVADAHAGGERNAEQQAFTGQGGMHRLVHSHVTSLSTTLCLTDGRDFWITGWDAMSSGNDRPDDSPSKAANSAPIRARRWTRPPAAPARSHRLALRLIGIPAAAVAGVILFRGVQDRFFLPECDSDRARHSLADVLQQLQLSPVRFEPIKTVSTSKEEVVCNAVLPLPDGGSVTVDYSFYWQGSKANMRYSVAHQPAPPTPPKS